MHNQISLNASLTNFTVNMKLHYQILGTLNADAHLIGSNTAKTGLTEFLDEIPKETPPDHEPPTLQPIDTRPYWVLIDSHAQLHNLLHIFRQFDYCKDFIVLITPNTPKDYKTYLQNRQYNTIITGTNHINLKQALEKLYSDYQIKTIVTDTGQTLNSILLQQGLLDEISLIIAPDIVGTNQLNVFKNLQFKEDLYKLDLIKSKTYNHFIHLHYKVLKKPGGTTNK
jgi:2,5-diamino-6-(ribosylamino)-4(3H)-pyrimidinone 5'-phosphate reductase